MVANNTPKGKWTRYSELQHKQSLGRQRKNAVHNPREKAMAILNFVVARIKDGHALDAVYVRDLDDATWCELIEMATDVELAVITEAKEASEQPRKPAFDEKAMRAMVDARTEAQVKRVYGANAGVIDTERLNDVLEAIAARCEAMSAA